MLARLKMSAGSNELPPREVSPEKCRTHTTSRLLTVLTHTRTHTLVIPIRIPASPTPRQLDNHILRRLLSSLILLLRLLLLLIQEPAKRPTEQPQRCQIQRLVMVRPHCAPQMLLMLLQMRLEVLMSIQHAQRLLVEMQMTNRNCVEVEVHQRAGVPSVQRRRARNVQTVAVLAGRDRDRASMDYS